MICAHCSKSFAIDKIENQRGKGLSTEIQCPFCQAWLGKSVILSWTKIISFYTGAVLFAWSYFDTEVRSIGIPVAIFSILLMLLSHIMDNLKVRQAPEVEIVDNSEHLKKYR
ncbi:MULTISPECIES: hypothetical protein [unclassified Shewanella]|uniref:hypothetical protein n=1 Tax=unclassified Shewanella TaxID=196818 RepID=UPI001BBFC27E|nr:MULTISPECIES: hypothetical protein [unclassified Shewanella]GIU13676.1 hypothetical protein TUM4444_22450 [Shewanella sp. MBTL60-112-B1]GIU28174.1 hypothetical protein TUM4445_09090 [Shewanella sp. MBTL60-112-B2]